MNLLKKIIYNKIDKEQDIRYQSYFDEQKRILNHHKKMIFKHKQGFNFEQIWVLIERFVLKDLKINASGYVEKIICKDYDYYSKQNHNLKFKIIEYEKNNFLILQTEYNDVKYFISYELKVINKVKFKITYSQSTKYPYALYGAKAGILKHENRTKFKMLIDKINKYIKNNIR